MTEAPISLVLIQASSKSWSGEKDECLYLWGGEPKFIHTAKKLLTFFEPSQIKLIAPEFDRPNAANTQGLEQALHSNGLDIEVEYSHDHSPLLRMIDATAELRDEEFILRINGQNLLIHDKMLTLAISKVESNKSELDLVKFADDYPAQMTFDVYKVGFLRLVAKSIPRDSPLHIHPKYFLFKNKCNVSTLPQVMPWSEMQLTNFRKMLVEDPGDDFRTVNEMRVPVADQLSFHYELVKPAIKAGDTILDLACGEGYGSAILSKKLFELQELSSNSHSGLVIAGDISAETLKRAQEPHPKLGNVVWQILDADSINLESESVDLFTCFETLEHIPSLDRGIQEFHRVLKFGGKGFFSTPQNCFGNFPMTFWHEKEFSREEVFEAVQKYFKIERFIGIKQGTIFQDEDPIGSNSFVEVTKV